MARAEEDDRFVGRSRLGRGHWGQLMLVLEAGIPIRRDIMNARRFWAG